MKSTFESVDGVPSLQLSLNSIGTSRIELPSLHRCIDFDVWNEKRDIVVYST